jgi:hypothetical protein
VFDDLSPVTVNAVMVEVVEQLKTSPVLNAGEPARVRF